MRNLYGSAVPARLAIDEQIIGRTGRLPGIPSSKLGLEILRDTLEDFTPQSYLGLPQDSEVPEVDIHSKMEAKMGMTKKPTTRGII